MNKHVKKVTTVSLLAAAFLAGCAHTSQNKATDPSSSEVSKTAEVSNLDKAIAILKSFETGDQKAIKDYVSEKEYIQHNLSVPDGREVVMESIGQLAKAGTSVEIVRSFEDGDHVVLQSKYQIAGGPVQAGFDVFRFKDGKIVEHWDNLQDMNGANPSGHTMLDGTTKVDDLSDTEQNKKIAESFVQDVWVDKKVDTIDQYIDSKMYIQHNPSTGDGLEATKTAIQGLIDNHIELTYTQIHQVLGQGNFVLVTSQGKMMGQDTAYYDLFRLKGGKIVEHWDTVSTIPAEDTWANKNGKF